MNNPFDNLGGINPFDDQLDGIGSSLKKAFKKVEKTVKKVLPKPIEKVRKKISKEIQRSPIAQGIISTVASVVATPAAGAAIKAGFAAKQYRNAKKEAAAVNKQYQEMMQQQIVSEPVPGSRAAYMVRRAARTGKTQGTIPYTRNQLPTTESVTKDALNYKDRINKKNPKFQDMIDTLTAQGKNMEEIVSTFSKSQAFVDTSKDAVKEKGFEQQLISDLMARGMSQSQAQSYAQPVISQLTNDAIAQQQNSLGKPVLIAGALAAGAVALYVLMAPKKKVH